MESGMQNKQIKLISKSKNFIAKHFLSGPIIITFITSYLQVMKL